MRILPFAALVLAAPPLFAQSESLSGTYRINGLNPDGSAYTGELVLVGEGTSVQAGWSVAGQAYAGKGQLEGRILTLNFGDPTPITYVLMPDGSLHGTWSDGHALEKASPKN
ncbi:hypothetical protein [Sagittula sp. S175]|uniref:LIC10280 family protein n=1 Tax=Sagittula sp. S175 TaxID=3415129 RepID=UPI003C7B0499